MHKAVRFFGCAAFAASVLAVSVPAEASPVSWLFSGVFDDGQTASGNFGINVYDYLEGPIGIATTTGPSVTGYTYTGSDPSQQPDYPTDKILEFSHADYHGYLHLEFSNSLTAPGVNPLVLAASYECDGYENYSIPGDPLSGFCPESAHIRYFTDGSAVSRSTSATPEPATLALFGAGLMGLAARRRKT